MKSYKDWKNINESSISGGAFNLGISNTQSLGLIGANTSSNEEVLEEMKKKLNKMKAKIKKNMEDDGEVVPPASKKDANPDADEEAEDDSEDDDKDYEDSDSEEDSDEDESDDDSDEEDSEEDESDDDKKKPTFSFMKKMKEKTGKKKDKKVKKENADIDAEFWASLKNQYAVPSYKNWDGISEEDATQQGPPPAGDPNASPATADDSAPDADAGAEEGTDAKIVGNMIKIGDKSVELTPEQMSQLGIGGADGSDGSEDQTSDNQSRDGQAPATGGM